MIKIMREKAKYFYWLFFIVIFAFVFAYGWSSKTNGTSGNNIVAEVGGYKITLREYWNVYERTYRFYKDVYKEQFDEEMEKKLNLKQTVLKSLIDDRIYLIAAADAGISISDAELTDAIVHDPLFFKDGAFSKEIYLNRLRLNRLTPEMYESSKRQELLVTEIRRLIQLSAMIPGDELNSISADEETLKSLKKAMINDAKEKAAAAFVEGIKKKVKIEIHEDLIS